MRKLRTTGLVRLIGTEHTLGKFVCAQKGHVPKASDGTFCLSSSRPRVCQVLKRNNFFEHKNGICRHLIAPNPIIFCDHFRELRRSLTFNFSSSSSEFGKMRFLFIFFMLSRQRSFRCFLTLEFIASNLHCTTVTDPFDFRSIRLGRSNCASRAIPGTEAESLNGGADSDGT